MAFDCSALRVKVSRARAERLDAPVEQGVHLGVVVLPVGPVDGRRVGGHRGVDEDRQRRDAPGLLELPQEEEHLLGAADGEGGDEDGAAARHRGEDLPLERRGGRVGRVGPVAVGATRPPGSRHSGGGSGSGRMGAS